MMKKHLFLRLCLMFLIGVSAFSCRTEEFHNEEEAHGNTQFHLTSKRISLNESKHKAKLLPELKKAKLGIEAFAHKNAKGKIVSYGNGVSIDTDDVIYIENGPNYHTYTFKINRDNAPADAPVENLVLTPLPDGSYKELLLTYDLTAAEKQQAANGMPVNTEGKVQITELAKGTYNNGNLQSKVITGMTCGWEDEVRFTTCSDKVHSNGELPYEMGGTCHAKITSQYYTVAVYKCDWIYSEGNPFGGAGPGETIGASEGTPGGGGGSAPGSCNSNLVFTTPQDPTTSTGAECENAVPTQLVLELPSRDLVTKCNKAKDAYNNPQVTSKYEDLKTKTSAPKESGFGFKRVTAPDGTVSTETFILTPDTTSPDKVRINITPGTYGYAHTHLNKFDGNLAIKIHSPKDIDTFIDVLKSAKNNGIPLDGVFAGMIASDPDTQYNVYQLMYTGNGNDLPPAFSDAQLLKLKNEYKLAVQDININTGEPLTHYELQGLLYKTLKKMNVKNVVLSKREYSTGKFYIIEFDEYGTPSEKLCP